MNAEALVAFLLLSQLASPVAALAARNKTDDALPVTLQTKNTTESSWAAIDSGARSNARNTTGGGARNTTGGGARNTTGGRARNTTGGRARSTTGNELNKSQSGSQPVERERIVVPVSGSATSFTHAQKDFEVGVNDLDNRLYNQAQTRLSRALSTLNKSKEGESLRGPAHIALCETYLGLEDPDRARTNLSEAREYCLSVSESEWAIKARYFEDLAEVNLAEGSTAAAQDAEEAINQCLQILQKNGRTGRELALAQSLLGHVLLRRGYFEEARDEFKKALPVLEVLPIKDRLYYARALEGLAAVEKKLGNEQNSNDLMKTALASKDEFVALDKTADLRGVVKYNWVEGIYGSRQIVDPVYPLKYMLVDGIRVACTVVRSYKHLAVLISLANCRTQPVALAVGPVELQKIKPGRKSLEFCDPGQLDEVLEEDVILDRTWRRRALCHIEKSRVIPGYLKNGVLNVDDFFGNNQWGLYGAWNSHLRDAPPIVTREQFIFDQKTQYADQDVLGFMRGNAQIHPTFIEVGGARSGVVFFLRERYEDAIVRLFIGNAELRFPFHVTAGQ